MIMLYCCWFSKVELILMASYAVAKMVFVCSVKTTVLSATEIIELKYSRLLLSKAIPLFRQMLNTREVITLLRVLVKDLFMNGKKLCTHL